QLVQLLQVGRVLVGHRVADGVGDVDSRRAFVDRDLAHLGGELDVSAGGVHRRELDVLQVLPGVRHRGPRLPLDVLPRGLQLVANVDVRGGDEGVDARTGGVPYGVPGGVDVGHVGARQAGDDWTFDPAGDLLHRFEVARGGDREPSLDH